MFCSVSYAVFVGLALQVSAAPSTPRGVTVVNRANAATPYTLPGHDSNPNQRAAAIQTKRDTFLYGPSIAGNTSYWPTGTLGNATVNSQFASLAADGKPQRTAVQADSAAAAQAVTAAGGITKMSDFNNLYEGQWKNAIPDGLDAGILSNYTDDLLFSMERLSLNPYSIKRLDPASDNLSFAVDDLIAVKLTGQTIGTLLNSGSLFYVDYSDQGALEKTSRYAAACDAYFYISPVNGDFLPLAVRTNVGSNLVYTPADSADDWLLAKMLFNLNDFWHSQWYHLAATHNVIEIVYAAAFRTLSDEHPVLALLTRLTPQLYSYRMAALATLINKGGYIDTYFLLHRAAAGVYTSDLYNNKEAGNFQANYFQSNLNRRGLIKSTFGPELKSFPFLEDASPIHASIEKFVATFVDTYYSDLSVFEQDTELQAWISEAIPANILDFPTIINRETLIDILTHVAFLGSVAHQTINTNNVAEAMATLPFHPVSFYQPVPTAKGITSLIPFLPGVAAAIGQISVTSLFSRPTFLHSEKSLSQMFNDTTMLTAMPAEVAAASAKFTEEMLAQSSVVSSRSFDKDGLSQGMPFIWKALDPQRAPYYLTI